MYELLNILNKLINDNFSEDFNKIENIIKSNELYNTLDMDEQELIMEDAKEKHLQICEDKKNLTDYAPSYKDVKVYMKKNKYNYAKEHKEAPLYSNFEGKLMTEGEIMSDRVKAVVIKKPTEEDLKRRAEIFEDAKKISANLPPQKSPEWLLNRTMRVSASEAGCLLNMNKHQAQYTFIVDKVFGSEFKGNEFCYHGNVFEDPIRMMYELNNDVHTEEFSSMKHKTNPILSASPDGIVSPYCRDMKTLTPLVGRMLEIKAPFVRKIQFRGEIRDTICPIYYWCQIQQQLECLDLDECDFIQCNIERYESRQAWLEDTDPTCEYKSLKYGNPKGVVIELIPIKLAEVDYNEYGRYADMTIWTKTKCLFPEKIDMSNKELDEWVLKEISALPSGYTLHKIIYWRLIEQNCTLVLRDREWFESQLPTYNKIWGYVEYLRANLDVAAEWKEWIGNQARKYNDKILAKLDELIEKKKASLEKPNFNSEPILEPISEPNPIQIQKEEKIIIGGLALSNNQNQESEQTIEQANEQDISNELVKSGTKSSKSNKSTKSIKTEKKSNQIKTGITIDIDSDDDINIENLNNTGIQENLETNSDPIEKEIDKQIDKQIEQLTNELDNEILVSSSEKTKRKYVRKTK